MINRPGVLYGQCSEICGASHLLYLNILSLKNATVVLKAFLGLTNTAKAPGRYCEFGFWVNSFGQKNPNPNMQYFCTV